MPRHNAQEPPGSFDKVSTLFQVGAHVLRVSKLREGRWTCTVDEGEPSGSFMTQAEAWEAGVREADRLDRAVQ